MLKPLAPKLPPLIKRPAILRLLIIALLAEIAYAVLNISTMPVYLVQVRHFQTDVAGLVVVCFLLSEAIFKGPMGHFADRFGCRTFLIVGPSITFGTALLTIILPPSHWFHHQIGVWETLALMAMRILDGVGAAMLWPAMFAEMGHTVDDEDRQQAMSLLNTCYLLGIALALPIGGIAEDQFNGATYGSAGLILAATLFLCITIGSMILIPRDTVHDPAALAEHEGFHVKQLIASFRSIPVYVLLSIITFAGIGFPMVIIKLFAEQEFHLSSTLFGALVFPGAIAMAVLSVPMSRLGQKLGPNRSVHLGMALCAGGLIFISSGALFGIFRTAWALALGGIPLGVGFLLAIPAWMTSVSDLDPKHRAANLGAIMTAQGLGAVVGCYIGSFLYAHTLWIGTLLRLKHPLTFEHYSPFMGCAIFITIGWLISLQALKSKPASISQETTKGEADVLSSGSNAI